ncbi:unnamed protein product [Chilo suppressalis]|uniref:STING ligand-binding domain-containing protein n=1 Tax=Chilo suppressalis TaxID=168631 RepID=A0ABN8EA93_CHISP|nr:unnamed protein product [Chilo suppressalis]
MKAEVKNLNKLHIYAVEILFAASIFIASQNFNTENKSTFYAVVARHVIYIYIVRGSSEAIRVAYKAFHGNTGAVSRCCQHNHKHLLVFVAAFGYLILNQASLFGEEFLYLYVGSLVIKCMDMGVEKRKVSYGTGMACSFFEGYLALMIPSDGHTYVGLHENIRMFEANESVRFPVRRWFIIITKTMYCPPDLKEFNIPNRPDLPSLEACKSLENVVKDVAGVKRRVYRNSAYKIERRGLPSVYIAAECATPLHTLHRVMKKKSLYKELEDIDVEEVVKDFSSMLTSILELSEECKGKCEVIYFDNSDPEANLAEVLLQRIREIEPNFEEIIRQKDE